MAEKGSTDKEQKLPLQPKENAYFSSMVVEKFSFKWTLEKFSDYRNSKTTPLFPGEEDERKCKWNLYRSSTTDKTGYFGFQLRLVTFPNESIFAVFVLKLKTSDNREICCRHDDFVFTKRNDFYKWEQLPKIRLLKQALKDDVLVIEVNIKCNVQGIDKYYEPKPPIHLLQMKNDFASLKKSKKPSDAQVLVGDSKIPVHSAILAARSPVFMSMFDHTTTEKTTKTIEISDIGVETTTNLLHFLYSCELPDFNTQNATSLLRAADKYRIDDLKEHCAMYLATSLNTSNVLDVLILADKCSAKDLKERAIDYIIDNKSKFPDIENSDGDRKYDSELILDVLREMSAPR